MGGHDDMQGEKENERIAERMDHRFVTILMIKKGHKHGGKAKRKHQRKCANRVCNITKPYIPNPLSAHTKWTISLLFPSKNKSAKRHWAGELNDLRFSSCCPSSTRCPSLSFISAHNYGKPEFQ